MHEGSGKLEDGKSICLDELGDALVYPRDEKRLRRLLCTSFELRVHALPSPPPHHRREVAPAGEVKKKGEHDLSMSVGVRELRRMHLPHPAPDGGGSIGAERMVLHARLLRERLRALGKVEGSLVESVRLHVEHQLVEKHSLKKPGGEGSQRGQG